MKSNSRTYPPLVSIVLVSYNAFEYTRACLSHIAKHTKIPYEIIIIDNGSTDNTVPYFKNSTEITFVANDKNKGFAAGCNAGASLARGNYIVFLNTDTLVTENWLEYLLKTIETRKSIGVVGPKLLFTDGTLQSAGCSIWRDGSCREIGRGDNHTKSIYNIKKEVDFISGACMIVNKEAFCSVNGFDTRFTPAYFEDADFCLRLRERGYRIFYEPRAIVYHFQHASSGAAERQQSMRVNQLRFISKWKDSLEIIPHV